MEAVAGLAASPKRWPEAHARFSGVRKLVLREEKLPTNPIYRSLLFVAELTAKTIYNATDPVDPFDEDSAWWLPACARGLAEAVGDPEFEEQLWRAVADGLQDP